MAETGKGRPWYAVALVAGFGGVLAAGLLAMKETPVRPAEAHVAVAGPAVLEAVTAEQLRNLTTTINTLQTQLGETIKQVSELNGRLSKVEGRLEK